MIADCTHTLVFCSPCTFPGPGKWKFYKLFVFSSYRENQMGKNSARFYASSKHPIPESTVLDTGCRPVNVFTASSSRCGSRSVRATRCSRITSWRICMIGIWKFRVSRRIQLPAGTSFRRTFLPVRLSLLTRLLSERLSAHRGTICAFAERRSVGMFSQERDLDHIRVAVLAAILHWIFGMFS